MKFSLPLIIDCIFSAFITFLLSLIIFNYFTEKGVAITFSVTLGLIAGLFSFKILRKKQASNELKKEERQELENMLTQFNFSSSTETLDFFIKLFSSKGYLVEKKKGIIYFKNENAAIFIKFGFLDVNKSDVVKFFNLLRKNDKGYIISESFSLDVSSFISRFDNRLFAIDGQQIYRYLKKNDALPETKYSFFSEPQKGFKLLKNLLYKDKAKNYLVFGLTFLLMSYFFPFKVYYVISGILFLLAALISRLFGLSPEKK